MEFLLPYPLREGAVIRRSLLPHHRRLAVPFSQCRHIAFRGGDAISQEIEAGGFRFWFYDFILEKRIQVRWQPDRALPALLFALRCNCTLRLPSDCRLVLDEGFCYFMGLSPAHHHSLSFRKGVHAFFQMELSGELASAISSSGGHLLADGPAGIGKIGHIQPQMWAIISEIRREMPLESTERHFFLDSRKQMLLSLMIRQINAVPAPSLLSGREKEMYEVKAYIEANFMKALCINGLARRFNFSDSAIRKHFKGCFDISIYAFILQTRLRHAVYLFESSDLSVAQVAYDAGFNDLSGFRMAFRKHTGQTPTEYIRSRRSGESSYL